LEFVSNFEFRISYFPSVMGFALQPRRVLVKEVNWLGDIVMSQPALRAVRKAYPTAHLAVLVRQELAAFFDGCNWIEEVLPYRLRPGVAGLADRARIVATLRHGQFDLAVHFPDSFDAALWAAAAGIPARAGYVRDARGWLLTHGVARDPATLDGHQAHYRLHMLRQALGINGDAEDFVPDVDEQARQTMTAWLTARRKGSGKLIALAPGATYGPAKEWPAANWAALIDLLAGHDGAECVLVGAPSERVRCEEVGSGSRSGALIAAGDTSVGELVALLSLCDAFAGNDSGAMHVAGALGVPTVGIFGSTSPERTSPLGPRTHVIYRGIECSPCLERTCRFGHYRCLTDIGVEEVARALAAS
jgi:heptosyltransferase-2